MPAVCMDDVRSIVESLIKQSHLSKLNQQVLENVADRHINMALCLKLNDETYTNKDEDGILSVSVAAFNPETGVQKYASGPIDPLNHDQSPVNVDTLYNLGSISKLIIMMMCMRLLQEKKISLDDTVESFIDVTDIPNGRTITIQNLLGHYSGLKDCGFVALGKDEPISKLLKLNSADEPMQKPGEQFYYANINFTILAKIICLVMNRNLQECVNQLICNPLNLTHLNVIDQRIDAENHAVGYKVDRLTKQMEDGSGHFIYGATSFRSTPSDLVKMMYHFFHDDEFISPVIRKIITESPHSVTFEVISTTDTYRWPATMGLGVEKRTLRLSESGPDITVYCHGGWQDSHAAFLAYSPETDTAYCCTVSKTQGMERVQRHNKQCHAMLFTTKSDDMGALLYRAATSINPRL